MSIFIIFSVMLKCCWEVFELYVMDLKSNHYGPFYLSLSICFGYVVRYDIIKNVINQNEFILKMKTGRETKRIFMGTGAVR